MFNRTMPYPAAKSQFNLPVAPLSNELLETSIGQGETLATPMQMALCAATLANNGIMMQPFLVERTTDANQKTIFQAVPKAWAQPINAQTAYMLLPMLTGVVEHGTGSLAAVENISIAGKTGTAQNGTIKDHSWFVAFAPSENPQIAIAVLLEHPDEGHQATVMAKKILAAFFENQ